MGMNLNVLMGNKKFAAAYLATGAITSLLYIFFEDQRFSHYVNQQSSSIQHYLQMNGIENSRKTILGASGCVMMSAAAFSVMWPTTKLYFFGIIPIPAALFVGLLVANDVYSLGEDDGIAHLGHLIGAACGLALGLRLRLGRRITYR